MYLISDHVHAIKSIAKVTAGELNGGAMVQPLLLAAHATEI